MTIHDDRDESSFPPQSNNAGTLSMHERMSAIGGWLDVCRTSEGASTKATLPLADENESIDPMLR